MIIDLEFSSLISVHACSASLTTETSLAYLRLLRSDRPTDPARSFRMSIIGVLNF